MVKVIMGLKGSGKTKQLIDLVTEAVGDEQGDVVVLEKGPKLTYDIPYRARLIQSTSYPFGSYDFLKGFISGLHAGNYDITSVFIDGLYKLVDDSASESAEAFLDWLEEFSNAENVKFTITISADKATATEGMKKYFAENLK